MCEGYDAHSTPKLSRECSARWEAARNVLTVQSSFFDPMNLWNRWVRVEAKLVAVRLQ